MFFKGGSGAHCVKWNITASAEDGDEGSELTLIKAQRLEKKQGDTVADSDGDLVLNSTTIGGKDGFKFLVDDGVDLSFKGEVTNCDGSKSDAVSFSTKVSELKLKQVWKGAKLKDEGTGKTRMFLRISKIKEGKKEPKKKGKGKGKGKGKS